MCGLWVVFQLVKMFGTLLMSPWVILYFGFALLPAVSEFYPDFALFNFMRGLTMLAAGQGFFLQPKFFLTQWSSKVSNFTGLASMNLIHVYCIHVLTRSNS